MPKNFIKNDSDTTLKKRLVELIQASEELKFLVGFFYFSGIRELYDSLQNNPKVKIKVLVGLNVDKTNLGVIEVGSDDKSASDEEKTYNFMQSIKKSLNTENFDTPEFYEQVKFFIKLIKEDRLIIRKTYNPNHAKLYIFSLEKSQVGKRELFLTGSSNLTKSGITTQEEFNVEISDYGFDDANDYYDELWAQAVKITERDEIKKKLINVVENETLVKDITPFQAFVLILKTYLDSFKEKEVSKTLKQTLEENGYSSYNYQLDAVKQALGIIENENGVIIADVVGLGKTIIACAVVKELKKRGLVICPPGLIGDKNKNFGWKMYLEEFGLYDWEVRSSGDLENVAQYVKNAKDFEVVIIDEAHRFRNEDTKDYENLKNICRNKNVILLTATPFNNRPSDILSLLKLFITPKKSSITLEDNLVNKFKHFKGTFDKLADIKKYHNSSNQQKRDRAKNIFKTLFETDEIDMDKVKQRSNYLSKQIRDVIEPVTIRRNRLDLKNNSLYKKEVKDLSGVENPKEWFYELTREQSEFYDKIITQYFGEPEEGGEFKGAIYRPFEYEKKRKNENLKGDENFQFLQQRNLFEFMRRLLVKRFESSFGSFKQSIKNFKNVTEHILEFIEKKDKYILDRPLLEKIYSLDSDEIEEKLNEFAEKLRQGNYPKNNRIYKLKNFEFKEKFINDIKSDLELYKKVLKELDDLNLVKDDPKSECLANELKKVLSEKPKKGEPKRKVVIFSEYLDTVKYLKPILKDHFGDRLLTIEGSLSAKKVTEINQNFDASVNNQENEYDILLTSDKISEGYNLNRAGMVVNYDIPWNPVRVIQRVGRINRISKKVFDSLYIVNFFPTEKGSTVVKSREIAQNKMFLIHNTLGEDSKIFDIEEEPSAANLYNKVQKNPEEMEDGESFYTKALNEFLKIQKEYPKIVEEIKDFPPRVKVSKKYNKNELLVFIKKGRIYVKGIETDLDDSKVKSKTLEEIYEDIKCSQSEKALALSNNFWESYGEVQNYKGEKHIPATEQSLEQRAINNIKTFIKKPWKELMPYLDFIKVLREDIVDYGTLSEYTLRTIANLEFKTDRDNKKTINQFEKLKDELGMDYLEKEKKKKNNLNKEIIIAVENKKYE